MQRGKQEAPAPFSLEKLSLPHVHGSPPASPPPCGPYEKHLQPLLPEALDREEGRGLGWTGRRFLPRGIISLPAPYGLLSTLGNEA